MKHKCGLTEASDSRLRRFAAVDCDRGDLAAPRPLLPAPPLRALRHSVVVGVGDIGAVVAALLGDVDPVAEEVGAQVSGVGGRQPRDADGAGGDVEEAGTARLQRHWKKGGGMKPAKNRVLSLFLLLLLLSSLPCLPSHRLISLTTS